ncbi:DUF5107 domain-containing protein [Arthrobacter silvisoli]|uniref:DUF5107 domain-containing protein n=1 Tax=Arthrobacter silvisoli TaxID=2291022 RepID=UPI000E219C66|nr:DUF5107 domain-containing protein [Arthrobacter silvisoli]
MTDPATPASATAGNITFGSITLDVADLGPESPLPPVAAGIHTPYRVGIGVPDELKARAGYGYPPNIYPYSIQDGYSRERQPRVLPAVVLENRHLKATVLPGFGGRIWELLDKATGKQLLHSPRTIQFANFALRNAWFAGGLEWNIGTRGHTPTSCIPWHTALLTAPDGQQLLRMWEFERLRGVVVQVDLWLPVDSRVLFSAIRLRNPDPDEVPMYWWSNAAVPETPDTRVIAPARTAFGSDYETDIQRVTPTDHEGADATWPVRNAHAADYFFDIPEGHRHWIAAVDADGDGLAMLSTSRLRGKKLFVWGQGDGGHNWQEWLSPGFGAGYAEIQAGLAQTQFEHLPMPGGAEWSWVEAYGNADLDAAAAHGDWDAAVEHAQSRLAGLADQQALDAALAFAASLADAAPQDMLLAGTGWGALEEELRRASGAPPLDSGGTPFAADTLTAEQAPWLELLRYEVPDAGTPFVFPACGSFVAGQAWERLLEGAAGAEARFHEATLKHARQDLGPAEKLYVQALVLDPAHALAHRGLALLLLATDRIDAGLAELRAACAADPAGGKLLAEAMTLHLAHGEPGAALLLAEQAPREATAAGRNRFLAARAMAGSGRTDEAAAILREGVEIPDLLEGDNAISELWLQLCPGEEVPRTYRFSMH